MHTVKQIAKNSFFYTIALVGQRVLSTLYFWYYSNHLPGGAGDLGKLQFVLSFVTLFFVIADFGLYYVFLRESSHTPEKANQYLNTLLTFKLPLFGIAALVTAGASVFLVKENLILILLAFVWLALDHIAMILYAILRSRQMLVFESVAVVVYQIVVMAIGVVSLSLGGGVSYLIFALLIGSLLSCGFAFATVVAKLKFRIRLSLDMSVIKFFLKSLPAFAVAGVIIKMLNTLDTVLLKHLSSDYSLVGLYNVPLKLINALALTVPTALMGSVFPAFSYAYQKSEEFMLKLFEKTAEYVLIVSVPVSFGFLAIGDSLIRGLFSTEYAAVIPAAQVMLFSLPFIFLAFPTGNLLNAVGKQRDMAISRGVGLAGMLFLEFSLVPKFGLMGAAVALLATHVIILAFDLYFIKGIFVKICRPFAKEAICVLIASVIMFFLIEASASFLPWYGLVGIGGASYFSILWILGGLDLRFIRELR